jgi:hypothetical protein
MNQSRGEAIKCWSGIFVQILKKCFQLIIDALLPHCIAHLESESTRAGKTQTALKYEVNMLMTLVVQFRALVNTCDVLAR